DLQVAQRAVEAVDMLLQPERLALEGARHVEGAVAILPAAVAERDHDLALRHEVAVEPGDALIAELLGHAVLRCWTGRHRSRFSGMLQLQRGPASIRSRTGSIADRSFTMRRYDKSIALYERTKRHLAGGVSSNVRYASTPVPLFFVRGDGARLYDVDG